MHSRRNAPPVGRGSPDPALVADRRSPAPADGDLRSGISAKSGDLRRTKADLRRTAAHHSPITTHQSPIRAAFTLVELMVVLIIAVILLAVTLPTVKYSLEEGKLREGARQFNAFFASAKARATTTGRPAGVWLELEQIGDPNAPPGFQLYQCSQLYLAEVPAPYAGDVLNAKCFASIPALPAMPNNSELNPWPLQVLGSMGSPVPFLVNNPSAGVLFKVNQDFAIRFDHMGKLFFGKTLDVSNFDDDGDGSTDETGEFGFYLYGRGGADGKYGRANVDDNNNGSVDADLFGPDRGEYGARGSDDVIHLPPTVAAGSGGYAFQLYRSPQRAGQPLELPQGIVVDLAYSGIGPTSSSSITPNFDRTDFGAAKQAVIVMFSPGGGVGSVAYVEQVSGNNNVIEDVGTSKVFFLVGKTEKMDLAWNPTYLPALADSNVADGSNLWVVVNRRNGSVATVENTPNATLPFSSFAERQLFMTAAREFARTGEVKGGQ